MTDEPPYIPRRERRRSNARPRAPRLRERQASPFAPSPLLLTPVTPPERWSPVRSPSANDDQQERQRAALPLDDELRASNAVDERSTPASAAEINAEADAGAEVAAEAADDAGEVAESDEEHLSRKERRARDAKSKPRPWWRPVIEFAGIVVVAALVIVLLKAVAFRAFEVPSESMSPTLITNDHIIAEMISPRFDGYKRGDIVVFKDPADWLGTGADPSEDPNLFQLLGLQPESTGYIVKRIIAVPGETIEGLEDGTVLINGKELTDDYGSVVAQAPFRWTLSEGDYWMMGDNRGGSTDSRVHGPVNADDFVGRVAFRFFPFDRLGPVD